MIKLGIDLATRKTGIVLAKKLQNGTWKIIYRNTLDLDKFNNKNMSSNIEKLKNEVKKLKPYNPKVYVELGNYGNAGMTSKFSIYAGVILSVYPKAMVIAPVNWQKYLTQKEGKFQFGGTNRTDLKSLSKLLVMKVFNQDYWGEDECDAFGIIYFSEFIKEGMFW